MPADLPSGWAWSTLGEVAALSLGKMLDKKQATGENPTPYLRNINVRWGAFDLSDVASMDIRPEELERVQALPGDVVACEGGEPGRAAVWRGPGPIALQKALHRIRPFDGIAPAFLAYALTWLASSRRLETHFTGTTIKHLPKEKLREVAIPLPPPAEQERIVAGIEEHLSRLDAAEAWVAAAGARLDAHERASVAARFSSKGWMWTTLGDIAELKGGVTKGAKKQGDPSFVEGRIFGLRTSSGVALFWTR